jgi:hypothetical protein
VRLKFNEAQRASLNLRSITKLVAGHYFNETKVSLK